MSDDTPAPIARALLAAVYPIDARWAMAEYTDRVTNQGMSPDAAASAVARLIHLEDRKISATPDAPLGGLRLGGPALPRRAAVYGGARVGREPAVPGDAA